MKFDYPCDQGARMDLAPTKTPRQGRSMHPVVEIAQNPDRSAHENEQQKHREQDQIQILAFLVGHIDVQAARTPE